MSEPGAAPAAAEPSRARKVLRRTVVGGSLALGVAALLGGAALVGNAWPVLGVGALLALLGVGELSGMGRLAGRGLGWTLWPAVAGQAVLVATLLGGEEPVAVATPTVVGLCVAWAALLAVAAHGPRGYFSGAARRGVAAAAAVGAGVAAVAAWFEPAIAAQFVGVLAALTIASAVMGGRAVARGLAVAGGAAVWIAVPLCTLAFVHTGYGVGGLAALLVLSKIGDVAGYYGGSLFGRHHPFPRLSPGKTAEGCAASFVAAVAAGPALVALGALPDGPLGWVAAAGAGAVANVAAQAGDLLESWVKRRAGVKDSSALFGPSGGVLDVVDSLLLTVPASLLAWPLLFPA